jgi:hypothetical protein
LRRQAIPLWTPYGTKKNSVRLVREGAGGGGIRLATAIDCNAANIPFGKAQIEVMSSPHRFKHSARLPNDLRPDAVAGQ